MCEECLKKNVTRVKMTQEEFDEIFSGMLKIATKTVWLNEVGEKSDVPTSRFELINSVGDWLFDINLDHANPHFWCNFSRVFVIFKYEHWIEYDDATQLMKNQLSSLFNLGDVTPLGVSYVFLPSKRALK